jgi:signal transduction histidine kinase
MNLESNKRLAKIMISIGLVLLTIGLSLWIYSEYNQKRQTLQEKVNSVFVQSILEVESYLSSQLITFLIDTNEQNKDSLDFPLEHFKSNAIIKRNSFSSHDHFDSKIFFAFDSDVQQIMLDSSPSDSTKLKINTSDDSIEYEITSIIKNTGGTTLTNKRKFTPSNNSIQFSINDDIKDLNIFSLLDESINSKLDSFNLSKNLNFNLTENDSIKFHQSNSSWVFKEIIFDKSFTFEVKDYQLFILKKIIPQIILSLFIIGIISLAFYFIYQTLLKQEKLNLLKDDFINNMTHELKTPITTIGVALEAIENFGVDKNPALRKEYIDISRSEVNRLSLLVDKVLNISKYENTEIVLDKEELDISIIIDNTLKSLKLQLQKHHAKFDIKTEGNSFLFLGDKSHMTNVIYNLIDNALKYGGTPPTLNFIIKEQENLLLFSLKDNGKGIPNEYTHQIFDKFFRIPQNDIHNVKGHGLGLSYVKKIIEMHEGKINLESQKNKGSTFTIEIPKYT